MKRLPTHESAFPAPLPTADAGYKGEVSLDTSETRQIRTCSQPDPKDPTAVYQLKITLRGVQPLIWRRLQVPASIRLCCLHDVFQIVVGWTDSHMHMFEQAGRLCGEAFVDTDIEVTDECQILLASVLRSVGDSMVYAYDLGEPWRHDVVLERIIAVDTATVRPVCLAGERHCPPEDVGGASGYQAFLKIIFNPDHEQFMFFRALAGEQFHAEEFSATKVNALLTKMRWPKRHRVPARSIGPPQPPPQSYPEL